MSDSNRRRNLPSWMSGREEEDSKRRRSRGENEGEPRESSATASASASCSSVDDGQHHFSKLMEGVVFVLSGFVNPERAELRSRALEMGAEFQTDWNPNCTLLICAFPNTPKFHQVEADSGTIVSKEWISECYNHRKLVDIEPYLLHAGKPWRRRPQKSASPKPHHKAPAPLKPKKLVEKSSVSCPASCASSEGKRSTEVGDYFCPSRVKKWATYDLAKTLSWLESQDDKPELSKIKKIAAEGILTCLQDTIDTLDKGQHIQQISEQWACIPRVVEELIKLDGGSTSVSKNDLRRYAGACKQIYEVEYSEVADASSRKVEKKMKTEGSGKGRNEERVVCKDEAAYDSDETVEMSEEEINQAYNAVASSLADFGS